MSTRARLRIRVRNVRFMDWRLKTVRHFIKSAVTGGRGIEMQIFGVVVNRDDTVRVLAADVAKETPQFYVIAVPEFGNDWRASSDFRAAFGYTSRIMKQKAHLSERAALQSYMAMRRRHAEDAKDVIAQATKQIASANELLMRLSDASSVAAGE